MTIDACCTVGVDREYALTPEALVREMDFAGVDRAVVSSPDRCLAVSNREGNDSLFEAAHRFPDRLFPSCAANPWYGRGAVEELRRALGLGARMLVVAPSLQGFALSDELLDPLVAEAAVARVPVYVHTGNPQGATPFELALRARRHPELDWIMGHSGATDFWNDVQHAARLAPNVYLESSFARPFIFRSHCSGVGFDRGIMGSGAPVSSLRFEWAEMRAVLEDLRAARAPGVDGVFGGNLLGLLGKRGPL